MKVFTINNEKEEKFLRKRVAEFNFTEFPKKELQDLIKKMRKIMISTNGVGLSANQLGMNLRFFVAQIPEISNQRKLMSGKFYAIFNPEIIKFSKNKIIMEEGCLSVPGIYGLVERPKKITLVGYDKNGRKIKIKAQGFLARVFQHEVDHLNGVLFIDRTKNIFKAPDKVI